MTDTQLKERLAADVDDVEAPVDLLERVRAGGARRLRRRRRAGIAGSSLAVAAVAAVLIGVPTVRDRSDQAPVATPTATPTVTPTGTATSSGPWVDPIESEPDDHYAVLMTAETGGNLARDAAYREQILTMWQNTRAQESPKPGGPLTGNPWEALRGEPRIYWAANTPAGRMAIVVQHYRAPTPDPEVEYAQKGIYTTVALVRDDAHGRPTFQGFMRPHDPSSFPVFEVRDPGKPSYMVVVSLGRRLGWGPTPDKLTPLVFDDGVAVQQVPDSIFEQAVVDDIRSR
jgi:hypothetical protein